MELLKFRRVNLSLRVFIVILSLLIPGCANIVVAREVSDPFIFTRNMSGADFVNPEGMAVDSAGNVWITQYESNSVLKLDPNGKTLSPSGGFIGGGLNRPLGITVDSFGNVWVANYGNDSVSKLDPNGKTLSPSRGFIGGGLNKPLGITVDSFGNMWVANYGNDSVSVFDLYGNPLSPSQGFTVEGLKHPFGISIDPDGNVWVVNEGNSTTELIGAASQAEGVRSSGSLELLLTTGGNTMEPLNFLGAEMLPNELTLLKIIIGVGFIGWMFLLLAHTVFSVNTPGAESGLDEYGCYLDGKTGIYHCVSGQLAGRDFQSKEEMLKLAA